MIIPNNNLVTNAMRFPPAPIHMYAKRSTQVLNFEYDTTNQITYKFNSLGYRSQEFDHDNFILLLGNSITFGMGLDVENTFGYLLEQRLNIPIYNCAWGAYGHTNHEQLEFCRQVIDVSKPQLIVWQINNLNRHRIDGNICFQNSNELVIEKYYDFINGAKLLLKDIPHVFVHWDNENYNIDLSYCLIYNKYHFDSTNIKSMPTFGIRSHKLIAEKLFQTINERL
jgi:hypothetical protein